MVRAPETGIPNMVERFMVSFDEAGKGARV